MSKIGNGGEKSCDACIDGGKGPAVVFCCTCRQFLCTLCHEYHRRNKILRHHQMVGLDQESVRQLPSIMTPTEHLCAQTELLMRKLSIFGHVMTSSPSQSTWSSKSAARMDKVYSVKVETKSSEVVMRREP